MLRQDEELLRDALCLHSPSGEEGEVAAYLAEQMAERGLNGHVDQAGNAIGEIGEGHPHVVLLGHIDTVPGFIPVQVRDGAIYGRGAVDAKGPFAAFVCAASRLVRHGQFHGRITLVGAVEEECVTSKGARHALSVYDPDMVVIGEPSGWDAVTLGYKGRLIIHYRLALPMAHTAARAVVPAEEAVAFWQKLVDYARAWNGQHGVTPGDWGALDPSLRHIATGEDPFEQRVEARMALRLPLGLSPDQAEADIAAFASGASVFFSGAEAAVKADKNTPLVRAFLAAIRGAGGEPRFKVKTGTSDMNVVAARWRCPMVAYGPGNSSLDHTPDEHLSLEEYARAIDVLERVLLTFCSQ